MICVICEIETDSVEEAIDEDWIPYFYEDQLEFDPACLECSEALLGMDENGEMELKEQYLGKVSYKGRPFHEAPEEIVLIGVAIENNAKSILN